MYTENNYKKIYVTIITIGIIAIIAMVAILGFSIYKWKNYDERYGIIHKTDAETSVFVSYGITYGEIYVIHDVNNQFSDKQRVTAVMYIGSDEPILWDVRPVEYKS